MGTQLVICLAVVGAAAAYLAWRIVVLCRGLKKGGCGGGCGCASKGGKTPDVKLIPSEQLLVRRR